MSAEEDAKLRSYKHGEAFALMWYECSPNPAPGGLDPALLKRLPKGCGHRERIWNSRDGVTPFGMSCPSCGQPTLLHADWQLDECRPDYKPNRFQRYWRDGTVDEAKAVVEQRIVRSRAMGAPIPDDIIVQLRKEARTQTGDWKPGWPALTVCLAHREPAT